MPRKCRSRHRFYGLDYRARLLHSEKARDNFSAHRVTMGPAMKIDDVARLPVREVVSALHFKADLTLGLGSVAFDYLAK